MAWNMENAEAGLRFQLVDRHPWAFHADGLWFVAIQAPAGDAAAVRRAAVGGTAHASRSARCRRQRYLGLAAAALVVLGFFVLGLLRRHRAREFPLAVAGLPARCCRWCRRCCAAGRRGCGGRPGRSPALRAGRGARLLRRRVDAVAARAVRGAEMVSRPTSPAGTSSPTRCASSVRGCRRARASSPTISRSAPNSASRSAIRDIAVLDHPLNRKHGRAPQLQLWGLAGTTARPRCDRCCWWSAPSTSSTSTCCSATTCCASRSGHCRRRAWSTSTTAASASCCSRCTASAIAGAPAPRRRWPGSMRPRVDATRRARVRGHRLGVQGRRRA